MLSDVINHTWLVLILLERPAVGKKNNLDYSRAKLLDSTLVISTIGIFYE